MDVFWQCAVVEFVNEGEIPASDINALLNHACGVVAWDIAVSDSG